MTDQRPTKGSHKPSTAAPAAAAPSTTPPPPPGVSARAVRFWQATMDAFELDDAETEVLREAAWTLTELDALREALARDGTTVAGSAGQPRIHPAVNEARQHRLALTRLLKALRLPDLEEQPESWTTRNARAAARARWDAEKARNRGA